MNSKLAIIASGGGMTCSYSVGSLLALIDKYKLTTPDIVIGASGGAGTLAYYVSGQYGSIRNIWANLLSTEKFLNKLRLWKVIDIDYLIDQVFKKQDPLQTKQIYNSPINFLIPYTNSQTAEFEYYSNRGDGDVLEALRATKAMPLVYGKTVEINGQNYCDTYLSSCVKLLIEKAKNLGAKKVLVLDNCGTNPVTQNGLSLWVNLRNRKFKEKYRSELNRINKINFDKNVFYLKPKRKLKISTLNNNGDLLRETMELGYNDTLNDQELEQFLKG